MQQIKFKKSNVSSTQVKTERCEVEQFETSSLTFTEVGRRDTIKVRAEGTEAGQSRFPLAMLGKVHEIW